MPGKINTSAVLDMYAGLEADTKTMTDASALGDAKLVPNESLPRVKQLIRWINKGNQTLDDSYNVADVDWKLTDYINQGYRLHTAQFVAENTVAFAVLYVLVLD